MYPQDPMSMIMGGMIPGFDPNMMADPNALGMMFSQMANDPSLQASLDPN